MTKELKKDIIDILDNVKYWETCPEDYKLRINEIIKQLCIGSVMHSVFTIHSTENDEIIKVVGTKDKAIQEVKEFKDGHAYADFYWQEQVLK